MKQAQINFPIHSNSIEVYVKILPKLKGRRLEVFDAIKSLGGKATLWDIGQYLNKPLNQFSGRVTELKNMEIIEDTKENKIINGSPFSILRIKE